MKRDVLKTLVERHIHEANGDESTGLRTFREQMVEAIKGPLVEGKRQPGITLEDVSIRNLFEAMCDRKGLIDMTNAVSVAEAITAAGMPTLTGQLLHGVFIKEYEPLANTVLPLVEQVDSTTEDEKIGGMTAHDDLELKREFAPFEESQPSEKYVNIKNSVYGRIISVSTEAIIYDKTGMILSRARQIGNKGGTHLHRFIVQKAIDAACSATGEAANTSLKINGTARAIYSNDHSAWDGVVNDNLETQTFSTAGMKAALALFGKMKDEKNDEIVVMPRYLLVPVALGPDARQLVGSPGIYDSGNRGDNPFRNAFTVVESPIVDGIDTTAWYVGDFPMQTRLQWVWRPRTEAAGASSDLAFRNKIVAQFSFSYAGGVGCTDYRFVVKGK